MDMAEDSDIAERVYSIYEDIIGEEFVAQYKGLYSMDSYGGQPKTRPVYAIVSDEFERKLDGIVEAVKKIDEEIRSSGQMRSREPVWKGITGPSSNCYWTRYWIWGSENSTQDGSRYGQSTYQINSIEIISFAGSIHTYMVELEVLTV